MFIFTGKISYRYNLRFSVLSKNNISVECTYKNTTISVGIYVRPVAIQYDLDL